MYPNEIEISTIIENPTLSKLLYSIKAFDRKYDIILHRLDIDNFEISLRFSWGNNIEISYYKVRNDDIQDIFNKIIIFMLDNELLGKEMIKMYTRYRFDTELLPINEEDINKYLVLKELID